MNGGKGALHECQKDFSLPLLSRCSCRGALQWYVAGGSTLLPHFSFKALSFFLSFLMSYQSAFQPRCLILSPCTIPYQLPCGEGALLPVLRFQVQLPSGSGACRCQGRRGGETRTGKGSPWDACRGRRGLSIHQRRGGREMLRGLWLVPGRKEGGGGGWRGSAKTDLWLWLCGQSCAGSMR